MTYFFETRASVDLVVAKLASQFQERGRFRTKARQIEGTVQVTVLGSSAKVSGSYSFKVRRSGNLILIECGGLGIAAERAVMGTIAYALGGARWGKHVAPLTPASAA